MDDKDKRDQFWCAAAILGLPFIVSGCWWLSPFLGLPAVMVGGILWLGSLGQAAELSRKKKQKAPEVRVETHYKFAGTHDERMERIRKAAAAAAQRNH